jgi:cysteine synthase
VSQALKGHDSRIQIVLADPQGSSLFNKVSAADAGCMLVMSDRQPQDLFQVVGVSQCSVQ